MEMKLPKVGDRIRFIDKDEVRHPIRKVRTVDPLFKLVTICYKGKTDHYVYFYEILNIY